MIKRLLHNTLVKEMNKGFVVGLFGARRTGKTFLMNTIAKSLSKVLMVQGDDLDIAEVLSQPRKSTLEPFIKGYEYLFIDEAQEIEGIGKTLKLLSDSFPKLKILITGSSAIDLRNVIGEPLVGRSKFFYLYPFSQAELDQSFVEAKRQLPTRLVFGAYPQVFNQDSETDQISLLNSIKNGYLLKDILRLDRQKDPVFILKLLRLIAFQIGHDISYSELASNLGVSHHTVKRYLNLLEQTFVIFSLIGFSRNLRKEYSKSPRFYFWDLGIRNAILNNFSPLQTRDDKGQLWENYCIIERRKMNHYKETPVNSYFWRTYDQQEVDLVEEKAGNLFGYEFKYGNKTPKAPKAFRTAYPESKFEVINPSTYYPFIH